MKKILLTSLAVLLFANPNLELDKFAKIEDFSPTSEKKGSLWVSQFSSEYLSKFNLSENFNLEKNKEITLIIPPKTLIDLDSKCLNLNSTILESVTYPFEAPTEFKKFAYIFNSSNKESRTTIKYDSNSVLNIKTDFSEVRNGPFLISIENENLKVRSFYNTSDVIPMKVSSSKDEVEFKNEQNYPPYFVSKRLKEKDFISIGDAKWIMDAYENLYGDYFKVNYKGLVCTDAATLILKTTGIDLENELDRKSIGGNSYRQKNVSTIKSYVRSLDPEKVHLFKGGDLEKVLKFGSYYDLTPENFGMEKFSPGQILLMTRFFNSGPKKGKIQSEDIHFGVVYDTKDGKITESSMVTSHTSEPPYNTEIQLSTIDFEDWYKKRSNYTGSDETTESLTYRIYGVMDWIEAINQVKSENNKLKK